MPARSPMSSESPSQIRRKPSSGLLLAALEDITRAAGTDDATTTNVHAPKSFAPNRRPSTAKAR
eukprot:887227-Prymnesium_polylepis.2